jgi:Ricin-type beta-trefoil lectin domain-like
MRRNVGRALAVLLGVTLSLAMAAPAAMAANETVVRDSTAQAVAPAAVAAGPYYVQFYHSGKCAEVPGASHSSGVRLDQWTCVPQSNVRWYFDYVGFTDGLYWYRIRSANSGRCMNVNGGGTADGAAIIQYACGAYANEYFALWRTTSMPSGNYFVEAFHSGKVLNVAGASTANGGDLIQYSACYCTNEYVRLG